MPNSLNHILTINSGSSSIKFSLYKMGFREDRILSGKLEGIGGKETIFHARNADGRSLIEKRLDSKNHNAALKVLFEWLNGGAYDRDLDAVGHRIVHGGVRYGKPEIITEELVMELRSLSPFVPEHLPHELDAVETVMQFYPALKQVACFDTAFHSSMPRVARIYGLPRDLQDEGVLRYGFHGLSYEYIIEELARAAGEDAADGRIIMAHLGHGASMAAVHNKKVIDTTMGFSPASGLVMSTRSGDLDPGVILYLLKQKDMTPEEVNEIVNHRGGMRGVSGTTGDMRELLEREADDPGAKEAVSLFCYHAKKFIGALTAALGGIDTIVFTGGIGENSPEVRGRICEGMEFMGINIDPERNSANAPVISGIESIITVRVIKTNEELMIARHTNTLLL
jgi:acetate kinase